MVILITLVWFLFFMLLLSSQQVVRFVIGLVRKMPNFRIYFASMITSSVIAILLLIGLKSMRIDYLPLTRLVKAVKDGLPLDKLEEHFHCTIFGASIKMVYDGDYVIKAVGAYGDTFYDRWTELSRDYRQDIQIKRFCDYVNWHLWNVSDMYGRDFY